MRKHGNMKCVPPLFFTNAAREGEFRQAKIPILENIQTPTDILTVQLAGDFEKIRHRNE